MRKVGLILLIILFSENSKGSGSAIGVDASGTTPFRVINHYHTSSEKFSDLNGKAVVGEYNVCGDGTTDAKMWIWE